MDLLGQKYKQQQQKLEAQERSFKENIAQLRDKLERERENFQGEQEKMLNHKLKVSLWFLRKRRAKTNKNHDPKENHKDMIH